MFMLALGHILFQHVQIQEESNKAAMRYDKANSQHAASKEMIRMAESQLGSRVKTEDVVDPSSPSPLDLAWQEMLNHATLKVKEHLSECLIGWGVA